MRIGYIVPSLDDTTGWGRWVNDFLNHIVDAGVEPVLWAPRSSASFSAAHNALPAYFVLPELFDSLRSMAGMWALRNAGAFLSTRRNEAHLDAVHSLDAFPWCLYGHALASAHDVPHVITSHGRYGYIPSRRLIDRIPYRTVLRSTARLIAVSDAVRREILKYFAPVLPQDRTTVLLNAVDAERVDDAGGLRLDGPPTIVSVTRFIRSKGILIAVEAFARVREKMPTVEYVIAGPGNSERNTYYAEVKRLIEDKRIEGITIAGRLSKHDLAALYRRSRLLLHTPITLPDDFEAYGLILLEAGVFGLPVVASRSGGHAEVITDGVSGLLAAEGDADATAEAVLALLTDPERAARMGAENRKVALARNWRWYSGEQARIYRDVIGAGPSAASPSGSR
jgi:glycosyltransferase involved in cell wall biosynthesis